MQPASIFYTRTEGIILDIFWNVDYHFRLLKENSKACVLGATGSRKNILVKLPEGKWDKVSDEFSFDFPESRAAFVVLKR
jgi:hypothetical protein